MLIWAHICAHGYCTQSQRLMCCCFPCAIYFCVLMGSLIDLVAREFQGCLSPPLLPSLGQSTADHQAQLFLCRFGNQIQVLILANKPFTIWVFSQASNYALFFLFSQFSLNVINHLANAMTAHNLGSAALMFLCRWLLWRKTMKHRNRLGYTLPSPKIS